MTKLWGQMGSTFFLSWENWKTLQNNFVATFDVFYEAGSFLRSLNTTFLVLIPEVVGPTNIRDIRPINLFGGMYKIIAKVVARRITRVVSSVC